ncbi:MAG: hypothetical protein WDN31_10645 [Hyphomicrobium sp.]
MAQLLQERCKQPAIDLLEYHRIESELLGQADAINHVVDTLQGGTEGFGREFRLPENPDVGGERQVAYVPDHDRHFMLGAGQRTDQGVTDLARCAKHQDSHAAAPD